MSKIDISPANGRYVPPHLRGGGMPNLSQPPPGHPNNNYHQGGRGGGGPRDGGRYGRLTHIMYKRLAACSPTTAALAPSAFDNKYTYI